ncbi:hypothetical protein [Pseudoalteromonas rubra]|uniref:hypothetical protein n=1 Tax=Pseudoalteromonas rubra TaxID=43658 RepID=UPI000F77F1E3|nr:hypothetical protein [Pseudoalteromonas rubra]
MAYDLAVGKSKYLKDAPVVVASICFKEYPLICALLKKSDNFFLRNICDQFSDSSFSVAELCQSRTELGELLVGGPSDEERHLLHKLLAVIGYALDKGEMLLGIAD